jgi:hypothetical protein
VENLRIRPVDEWDHCLVYTPANPNLVSLNLNAWLVLELCGTGNEFSSIERGYREAIDDLTEQDSSAQVAAALTALTENGLVERVGGEGGSL